MDFNFQCDTSGQYSTTASQRWEIDQAATILDVGDVAPSPGKEIFYLTRHGISYYPQKEDGNFSITPHNLLSFPTITVYPAAGSLPWGRLFTEWKRNGRTMLLLPQFDSLVFFDRSGSDGWQKTESVTIVPRTFLFSDQVNDGAFRDFSLHAEFRKNLISKRVNLDTSIYLLRSDNQYPTKPDFHQKTSYQLDLTHGIRFHGAWPTLGGDFTGDGHRDLLIARDEKIAIYPKNQNGDLFSKPLTQFEVFTSPFMNIVDLNGDGRDDLIFYEKRRDGKISILLNAVEWKDMPALEKKSMPFDKK